MDRNLDAVQIVVIIVQSLSARRAWIEIGLFGADSVPHQSLSARRAWIEIESPTDLVRVILVALRKESVDRNLNR